jgi:hypothetical protein
MHARTIQGGPISTHCTHACMYVFTYIYIYTHTCMHHTGMANRHSLHPCMYVCIYIHVCIYMCVYIYIHTHTYIHKYTHIHAWIAQGWPIGVHQLHPCMYVYTYIIYIYIYTYIHTHTHIQTHTHGSHRDSPFVFTNYTMYLHTYIHTYIYIYIQTHTHGPHRDGPSAFTNCTRGCGYVSWVSFWFWVAIAVFIVVVIACPSFAFSRTKPGSWCGVLIGIGANCGGRKPTMPYSKWAYVLNITALMLLWTWLMGFNVTGYISSVQLNRDILTALSIINSSYVHPLIEREAVRLSLMLHKSSTQRVAQDANTHTTNIPQLRTAASRARTDVLSARTALRGLQMYIEGCKNTTGPPQCKADKEEMWYTCQRGVVRRPGVGALMSNGMASPACRSRDNIGTWVPCPCCTACAQRINEMDQLLQILPDESHVSAINKPVVIPQDLDFTFGNVSVVAEEPYMLTQTSMSDVRAASLPVLNDLLAAETTRGAFESLIWLPTWVCLILLFPFAVILSFTRMPGGVCCWWTAYGFAVLSILVVLPFFSLFSILGMPMMDFCQLVPVTYGDAEPLLGMISRYGNVTPSEPPLPVQGLMRG